jgi:hypothetical protein
MTYHGDLDRQLRRATGDRLAYDDRAGELVVRPASAEQASEESRVAVGVQAVRNALQSALLQAGPTGPVAGADGGAGADDAFTAGARALLAAYDADSAAADRLVRRAATQFAQTAAARRRRQGG